MSPETSRTALFKIWPAPDANATAKSFIQYAKSNPYVVHAINSADESENAWLEQLLTTWFTNAMQHGYDECEMRRQHGK